MSVEGNPLTNKLVIQAFSDGVVHTLSTMAKTIPTAEKPFVDKKYNSKGAVAGMIGMVSGNIKGNLTISFEKEAALAIINNMIGETHTEIDEQVLDAIGELTNIIYGCAKTILNEFGFAFQMAIPIVIEGHDGIIPMHRGTTLVLPFKTGNHNFYLEIIVQ
ncbi:MAG: chemotaxis protein CheX [Pseudomonadota bacterium]|nr:chemotaxis protein CheX [Pseudomonadota bacterium]